MSDGEGTSFLQWRARAQSEASERQPKLRGLLITAGAVVVLAILTGVIVLMLS